MELVLFIVCFHSRAMSVPIVSLAILNIKVLLKSVVGKENHHLQRQPLSMGKSELIDLTDVDKLFEGRLSKQQKLMKTYVSR